MPYRPQQRRNVRAETTLTYAGETVKIWYRPAVVTPRLLEEITSASDANNRDLIMAQIERIVAAWEVLDENDQQLPVTREVMQDFELYFLIAVAEAIGEAIQPSPSNVVNFAAG